MDHHAVLAHPIGQVFGHLADPARLGDWLTTATAIHAAHGAAAFTLRLSRDPAQAAAGSPGGPVPTGPPAQVPGGTPASASRAWASACEPIAPHPASTVTIAVTSALVSIAPRACSLCESTWGCRPTRRASCC